jgi:hypothetical protein
VSPQISCFNFIPTGFGIMRRRFCESGSIKRDDHHERISAFVTEASRESSPSLLFTFHHVRMQQTAALTRNQHWHHDLGLSWARKMLYHLSHSAVPLTETLRPDHRCIEHVSYVSHPTTRILKLPLKTSLPAFLLSSILCLVLAFKKESQSY